MKCKWYFERDYACANSKCPYGGDTCPTSEHPEVCKYAEEKPKPELNAEELVTALRLCAGGDVRGLPLHVYRGISRLQRLCKAESRRHARKADKERRQSK
jgi:hypothetical protein